ncbi:MAG: hypothetical protein FD123_1004 [Bacteroidetes bacterium]|nr:MAG: hypothetical protein FD123_1004 [Bacteroidota bacterium]
MNDSLSALPQGKSSPVFFLRLAGHVFFLLLFLLAMVYAVERVSHVDAAWQFWERVNGGTFVYPESRYGVILSELPLWLAVKAGLPFNALVYINSGSYIVLYYGIWLLCVYRLKNMAAGTAVLFALCLGIKLTFLHTVTESHQAIIFSVLLFAVLNSEVIKKRSLHILFSLAATILVLLTHPFALFTAGFAAAWQMVVSRKFRSPAPWLVFALVAGFSLFRFLTAGEHSYDATHYDHLKSVPALELLSQGSYFIKIFGGYFAQLYWLPSLVFIITVILMVRRRDWLKLSVFSGALFFYIIVAAITFYNGDSLQMMERAWLPPFFMLSLAFAGQLAVPEIKPAYVMKIMPVLFLFGGLLLINQGCIVFRKRAEYYYAMMEQGMKLGADQVIIPDKKMNTGRIQAAWAMGTESLVLSTFRFGKSMTIIPQSQLKTHTPGFYMINDVDSMHVNMLNPKYFQLSGNGYVLLTEPVKE